MISLFSSSCPIVVKHCSIYLGAMNEAEVLDAVESTFVIVFLMVSILSVKQFIKPLLLNCEGIFRSGDICLFVNLATVLNKNLGLFWLSMRQLSSSAWKITRSHIVNISNMQHARYKKMASNTITLRYDICISKINSMRYN